ncbi:MAG: HAD family hydrolase [Tannerellaceae bacterium]|nr:HAD family hydrolase [Tannerellaceae bacterium]MCD8263571.1 HAD family hydrolase [Tannerellaceae bacterium]
MICIEQVKGIIFDYGGTLDSNGMHWAEVIWMAYEAAGVPVSKANFRDAYVHGERTLGKNRIVLPHHTFGDMLRIKAGLQIEWLKEHHFLDTACTTPEVKEQIAAWCYTYAANAIGKATPIVESLARQYPLVLVSNFYGNIEAVLKDFGLEKYFQSIVESAVVGIRKPDPAIFELGLKQIQLPAGEVVVIGDSHDKDIVPATRLGCQTIWLKSIRWSAYQGDETAGTIIEDFSELKRIFNL